jgi:hypothetical protein
MFRKRSILLLGAAATLIALAVATDPALAQGGDPGQAGDNFADFLRDLLKPILITVAAAIGIAAVVRRDFGLALTLIALVLIVGSFLIEDSPWEPFTEKVAKKVLGEGK